MRGVFLLYFFTISVLSSGEEQRTILEDRNVFMTKDGTICEIHGGQYTVGEVQMCHQEAFIKLPQLPPKIEWCMCQGVKDGYIVLVYGFSDPPINPMELQIPTNNPWT